MSGRDLVRLREEKRIAAVLDIEGSYDLDGDLDVLRALYQLGLRSAQISAHNWNQHYADSCCTTAQWNGLTAHGRDVVREMNRLGMVINVSHSADTTMAQVIDASERPVIATHHGLRQVNDIPRNISDALLKKLVDRGGVIGFQIGSEFSYPREYAWITAHRKKTFWDTHQHPGAHPGQNDLPDR
jgi:membrane dipeptidase